MMTEPTELVIVRHGETDESRQGIVQGHFETHLNSTGRRQARQMGEYLAGNHCLTSIVSSDLVRAQETAEEIIHAMHAGGSMTLAPALRELQLGSFQGRRMDELEDFRRHDPRGESASEPEGGESLNALRERVWTWLEQEVPLSGGGTVLIVTHRGPMSVFLESLHPALSKLQQREALGHGFVLRARPLGSRRLELIGLAQIAH